MISTYNIKIHVPLLDDEMAQIIPLKWRLFIGVNLGIGEAAAQIKNYFEIYKNFFLKQAFHPNLHYIIHK